MNYKVLLKESCNIAAHEPVSAGGKPRDFICEIMIEMALLTNWRHASSIVQSLVMYYKEEKH